MILTDTAVSGKFPENFQRIAAYSPAIASIVIFLDPTYNFCNPNVTIQHLYSYFSITNDTASCGRTEVPWNIYLKHISPSESSPRTQSSPTTTAANSSSPSIPGSPRGIWNSISSIFWRPTAPDCQPADPGHQLLPGILWKRPLEASFYQEAAETIPRKCDQRSRLPLPLKLPETRWVSLLVFRRPLSRLHRRQDP